MRWNLPGDRPSEGLGERVEVGGREARFSEQATERESVMLRWAIDDSSASLEFTPPTT